MRDKGPILSVNTDGEIALKFNRGEELGGPDPNRKRGTLASVTLDLMRLTDPQARHINPYMLMDSSFELPQDPQNISVLIGGRGAFLGRHCTRPIMMV